MVEELVEGCERVGEKVGGDLGKECGVKINCGAIDETSEIIYRFTIINIGWHINQTEIITIKSIKHPPAITNRPLIRQIPFLTNYSEVHLEVSNPSQQSAAISILVGDN